MDGSYCMNKRWVNNIMLSDSCVVMSENATDFHRRRKHLSQRSRLNKREGLRVTDVTIDPWTVDDWRHAGLVLGCVWGHTLHESSQLYQHLLYVTVISTSVQKLDVKQNGQWLSHKQCHPPPKAFPFDLWRQCLQPYLNKALEGFLGKTKKGKVFIILFFSYGYLGIYAVEQLPFVKLLGLQSCSWLFVFLGVHNVILSANTAAVGVTDFDGVTRHMLL